MRNVYIEPIGNLISSDELSSKKATATFQAVQLSPFARNIEQRRDDQNREILIVDADIEVPQFPVVDIKRKERLEIIFDSDPHVLPKVLMLRDDFPKTAHLLLEPDEKPRSLCLYAIAPDEVNITWTATQFIRHIRNWLKLTAVGQLHQQDQPLEPLLAFNEGDILIDVKNVTEGIHVFQIGQRHDGRLSLLATTSNASTSYPSLSFKLEWLTGQPQVHGILHRAPRNLLDLSELLAPAGIYLVDFLLAASKEYISKEVNLQQKLLLIISLPKTRHKEDRAVEALDTYAFATTKSLAEIFTALGIYDTQEGNSGPILGAAADPEGLKTVPVGILNPVLPFTKDFAAIMNKLPIPLTCFKICAVGAGALGSQLSVNLIRSGIGQWTFLDKDLLYPHNLSRHALTAESVLQYKASELARFANSIIANTATAINCGIHAGNTDAAVVEDALRGNDIVLDISASSAVLKVLAEKAISRIVSISLSPSGNDLVMFAEDQKKECQVDQLEIQYLRFILQCTDLHEHFQTTEGKFRYGTSCRDVSSNISQDNVALASAIASKALRKQVLEASEALLNVWKIDDQTGDVKNFSTPVFKTATVKHNGWAVKYDQYIVDKLASLRQEKLPKETGGLLVGSYDMIRKIVYVADVISSPEDSIEYPTAYIRRIKGVKEVLQKIEEYSAGALQYIGEWHSHPAGCTTKMSDDDLILFCWLQEELSKDGYPALLLIAGDRTAMSIYIQ